MRHRAQPETLISSSPSRIRRHVKPVSDEFPRRSSLDASVQVVAQTFVVHSATVPLASPGNGILAVSTYRPGEPPLALLADLHSMNKGASLTNAASTAINFVAHTAFREALGVDFTAATWVELDTEGCFDLMTALWPLRSPLRTRRPEPPHVSWAPLRHDGRSRTLDAFLAKFPSLAPAAWHEARLTFKRLSAEALSITNPPTEV